MSPITPKDVVEQLSSLDFVTWGRSGTILSIGCYSECWDGANRKQTIELLNRLLCEGNPVQIATKRVVRPEHLAELSNQLQWDGQLIFNISCVTISLWKQYEPGTAPPSSRFKNFGTLNNLGVPSALYVKPILDDVTIRDKENFAFLMREYHIPAIIGSRFSTSVSAKPAPIGGGQLFEDVITDDDILCKYLSNHGDVYRKSTDLVERWRLNNG